MLQSDEAEIHSALDALNAAWNAGDADAFGALFTDDADYVVFDGSRQKGRREITESHRALFEGFLKGTRLAGLETSLRPLSDDVVVVHTLGGVVRGKQQRPSKRALSRASFVVVRRDGKWRIAAFQNTRYRPFADTMLFKLLALLKR